MAGMKVNCKNGQIQKQDYRRNSEAGQWAGILCGD